MILIYDNLGPTTTRLSVDTRAAGGSDLHVVQIAEALVGRGHEVVVAKGDREASAENVEGRGWVRYVPASAARDFRPDAVILHRASHMPVGLKAEKIAIHATDIYTHAMDVHAQLLASGRATLVAVSRWLAGQFTHAERWAIIPPMLDPLQDSPTKDRSLFVFVSAPWKGLDETRALWGRVKPAGAGLAVLSPGYGERVEGFQPKPDSYRRVIAGAAGLFYVNVCPETYCTAAAMAERYRTRTHILAVDGACGLDESVTNKRLLASSEGRFIEDFHRAYETPDDPQWYAQGPLEDLSPAALAPRWEAVLS